MLQCPKCGGVELWDNRQTKRNPKQPDYKCRNRQCDGAIWLDGKKPAYPPAPSAPPVYEQGDPGPYNQAIHATPATVPQAALFVPAPVPPTVRIITPEDVALMDLALAHATTLMLSAIKRLDAQAPGNDITFTGDNICSVAATLFIETQKKGR